MKTSIPIYVINLKRNPERKLFMQRQLDALGLKYQFVDAIDKYDLASAEYRSQIARSLSVTESNLEYRYSETEGIGHVACLLSHIKVYNLMLKNNDNTACILEDDATLLSTFPQVLNTASKFSWDILLLANSSYNIFVNLKKLRKFKHVRFFRKDILFVKQHIKHDKKEKNNRIETILKEYGLNSRLYPKQSEIIVEALQKYSTKITALNFLFPKKEFSLGANTKLYIIKHDLYRILRRLLKQYTYCQLGALPEKSSLDSITDYHCISKPRHTPSFAGAYLLKQSAATKWKAKAAGKNLLFMDTIPWELYKNEQIKLRLITPPCATATYCYLAHSSRDGRHASNLR